MRILRFILIAVLCASCSLFTPKNERTALDAVQTACIIAHASSDDATVAKICGIADALLPVLRDLLADQRTQLAREKSRVGGVFTSGGGGGATGGWQTAFSVSFAGATDPGLAANGTYVLAGLTVKRENAVNDRVAMSVGAGGVSIAPNASSYLPSSNLRSAPLLWFSIPVALDWTTSLRLSIRISSSSQGIFDNGHNVYVGLDTDSTSFASWCGQGTNAFLGRLFDSGVAVSGVGQFSNRAAGGAASTGAFVLTCEIPQLLKPELEALALYRDAVAAWPDFSTLSPVVGVASLRSPFDALNPSNVAVSTRLGIVVAADAPSSSDAYTVTVSDLRVEYRL